MAALGEGFVAVTALVGFSSTVYTLMDSKVAILCKLLPTVTALIWFLFIMYSCYMLLEITTLSKLCMAQCTLMCPHPIVYKLMMSKTATCRECFVANMASVGLQILMYSPHMLEQVTFPIK